MENVLHANPITLVHYNPETHSRRRRRRLTKTPSMAAQIGVLYRGVLPTQNVCVCLRKVPRDPCNYWCERVSMAATSAYRMQDGRIHNQSGILFSERVRVRVRYCGIECCVSQMWMLSHRDLWFVLLFPVRTGEPENYVYAIRAYRKHVVRMSSRERSYFCVFLFFVGWGCCLRCVWVRDWQRTVSVWVCVRDTTQCQVDCLRLIMLRRCRQARDPGEWVSAPAGG